MSSYWLQWAGQVGSPFDKAQCLVPLYCFTVTKALKDVIVGSTSAGPKHSLLCHSSVGWQYASLSNQHIQYAIGLCCAQSTLQVLSTNLDVCMQAVRTKSGQGSTQAVAATQHPGRRPAVGQLLYHSGHVLLWLIWSAHACKLLQEACTGEHGSRLSTVLLSIHSSQSSSGRSRLSLEDSRPSASNASASPKLSCCIVYHVWTNLRLVNQCSGHRSNSSDASSVDCFPLANNVLETSPVVNHNGKTGICLTQAM